MQLTRCCLALASAALACSCSEHHRGAPPERAFYHWKSSVNPSPFELKRLDSLSVQTLYLKFFDVEWQPAFNKPVPAAKLMVPDTRLLTRYRIIPTVFIANDCLERSDSAGLAMLAANISHLVTATCKSNAMPEPAEIQIDCDWTAATRQKYFTLLKALKNSFTCRLSATIRLHQVKFLSRSGIPPVDRGLLMCYNMGNLRDPSATNSILDLPTLERYVGRLSEYPLPLDVALPLFEWTVLFRYDRFNALLQDLPRGALTPAFTKRCGHRLLVLKDTVLFGYRLLKGDLLRQEAVEIAALSAAAKIISARLKPGSRRISFYHLDSLTLRNFSADELETVFRIFD